MVLDCYTPNTIETFKSKFHTQNKNIIKTKYKEATLITKKYVNEKSVNTLQLKLSTNRIFQCIDEGCKPGQSKDPFTKEKIEAGLQSRLNEPLPDQRGSSLCGPAVYFFCLINISPERYKLAVKQLWEAGQTNIGALRITPSDRGCRKVKNFYKQDMITPRVPSIDWITLASLRESENFKLFLKDPDQEVAGITTWFEVADWFKKSGFKGVKTYPFYIHGYNPSLIYELNQYAGTDYYVVTLISASILKRGGSSGTPYPDHWIVWTDKLTDLKGNIINGSSAPYTTKVKLKIFTWGEILSNELKEITLYEFEKKYFLRCL